MRRRWVWMDGELVEVDRDYQPAPRADYHVIPDIKPYKSMIDGSEIGSRSKHREHLRQHGMIEIGNEVKHMKPFGDYTPPPGRKEVIIRAAETLLRRKGWDSLLILCVADCQPDKP